VIGWPDFLGADPDEAEDWAEPDLDDERDDGDFDCDEGP